MANNAKTNENLIIYQKYLDLIYYTNDLCRKYPKSEKPALAAETKGALYSRSQKFDVCIQGV